MAKNACCCWDFTLHDICDRELVDEWLKKTCKKWCYQLEKGELTKKLHYQGRVSLKLKARMPELWRGIHWSVTSKENMDNDFYVCKEDSRVEGPWRDDDPYIPRQIREISELYNWQKELILLAKKWDTRTINVLVDKGSCKGKSILVGKMCCELKIARKIPPLSNYKELMCMVMCMPESKCYLIDMPRALDKSKQEEFFSALESIKDGHVWDNRYTYKEKWFDSPNVWVFTNTYPDQSLLTPDRWKLWSITETGLRALRCNTKP